MISDFAKYGTIKNKFRKDIEGLRAVAVIPVLLFHANFQYIDNVPISPGGFIGVDVFFVISGYLISGYIYHRLIESRYDIVEFYGRRIRRLFPAIFVIYIFCLAVSTVIMLPSEAAETRSSVMSSMVFSSNMYFATKAGYFGGGLNSNPLLHTWSLSVEEQFYVVFPLVLLAVRRLPHKWRIVLLAGLALLSLGYSQYLVLVDADQAYYRLSTRFWELLSGSLLAISATRPAPKGLAEAIAAIGLLAIVYSVTQYSPSTQFPGLGALLPCMGTVCLLYAGRHQTTYTGRLLALPPLLFFGKISYSLYLWHWPLIVFCRLLYRGTHPQMLGTLVLSVVAAWLSWRYVEQPIRNLSPSGDRFAMIKGALAAAALTLAMSFATTAVNARMFPATPQTAGLQAFADRYDANADMRSGTCFFTTGHSDIAQFRQDLCLDYRPGAFNVLLVGDSHSAQYFRALSAALPKANVLQVSSSGCLPLLNSVGEPRCTQLWHNVTQTFLPSHHVGAIVLGGYWQMRDVAQIMATAGWLTRFADRVYVVGPNPTYMQKLPRLMIMAHYKGDSYLARRVLPDSHGIDAALAASRLPPRVVYLSYYRAMCQRDCPLRGSDGNPAAFDENHLTTQAAKDVFQVWARDGLLTQR